MQESVNAFAAGATDTGAGTSVEGLSVGPNAPGPEGPSADLTGLPTAVNQTPFAAPPVSGTLRNGGGTINLRNGGGYKLLGRNLAEMAALTGGAAVAIGLCVWLLLGVVDSLSKGTPLRLPGL